MAAHSLFKCKCLFYSRLHVGVVLFRFVIGYETAFPQRADSLDALELVGLFAFVGTDGQLVAAQVALASELVEDGVLHEIGLHVPLYGYALPDTPFVQVIEPAHHFGDAALPYERFDVPQLRPDFSPQLGGLVVVLRRTFERGVDIQHQFVELF